LKLEVFLFKGLLPLLFVKVKIESVQNYVSDSVVRLENVSDTDRDPNGSVDKDVGKDVSDGEVNAHCDGAGGHN